MFTERLVSLPSVIVLLSAAAGFVAFYVVRLLYALIDRPTTFGRLMYVGGVATVLYSAAVWSTVPGDVWNKIGYLMLSLAAYIVTTTVFRLVEAVTELVNLRHLLERPRR